MEEPSLLSRVIAMTIYWQLREWNEAMSLLRAGCTQEERPKNWSVLLERVSRLWMGYLLSSRVLCFPVYPSPSVL
jgi:hypothetical protein